MTPAEHHRAACIEAGTVAILLKRYGLRDIRNNADIVKITRDEVTAALYSIDQIALVLPRDQTERHFCEMYSSVAITPDEHVPRIQAIERLAEIFYAKYEHCEPAAVDWHELDPSDRETYRKCVEKMLSYPELVMAAQWPKPPEPEIEKLAEAFHVAFRKHQDLAPPWSGISAANKAREEVEKLAEDFHIAFRKHQDLAPPWSGISDINKAGVIAGVKAILAVLRERLTNAQEQKP